MSENLKTIKELADELSVTKQNIQYHYQRLPKELQLKSSNGSNLINSKAEKIILGKVESGSKSNTKDQQISSKDQQIEKLTNLLDQQQRLALQDKKLIEEYKEEIKELKSLMVPVRKDDKYPMVQKSKDIDNIKEEPHKKNKKWWHLGK